MSPSVMRGNKTSRWREPAASDLLIEGVEPYTVGQSKLTVQVSNLVDCAVEGLVCYASSALALHSVVASKLVDAGGASIRSECAKHLPAEIGEVVVVSAGKLPARYLFVAITNHIKAAPTLASIRASIHATMVRANQLGLHSIALPTMRVSKQLSPNDALLATLAPIVDHLSGDTSINDVVLVIDDADDFPLLAHYLPRCIERLSAIGSLRAAAYTLREAEHALVRSAQRAACGVSPLITTLDDVIQQELALHRDVLHLLRHQQQELGPGWQASHQVEVDLAEGEIARLTAALGGDIGGMMTLAASC